MPTCQHCNQPTPCDITPLLLHGITATKVQVKCFIIFPFAEEKGGGLFYLFIEGMKGCPQKVNDNTGYVACGTSSITTHHSTTAALPPPPTMQVECFFFSFNVASKNHHNTNTTKGRNFFAPHTHTHTHTHIRLATKKNTTTAHWHQCRRLIVFIIWKMWH